jgi:hypothetical protein
MNELNNISKDPRIMDPLAELLKKVREILCPSPSQTKSPPSPETQDLPSSQPHSKQ